MTDDERDAQLARLTGAFEVFCNAAPGGAQVVAVVVSSEGTGLFGNVESDTLFADALHLGVQVLDSDAVAGEPVPVARLQ